MGAGDGGGRCIRQIYGSDREGRRIRQMIFDTPAVTAAAGGLCFVLCVHHCAHECVCKERGASGRQLLLCLFSKPHRVGRFQPGGRVQRHAGRTVPGETSFVSISGRMLPRDSFQFRDGRNLVSISGRMVQVADNMICLKRTVGVPVSAARRTEEAGGRAAGALGLAVRPQRGGGRTRARLHGGNGADHVGHPLPGQRAEEGCCCAAVGGG